MTSAFQSISTITVFDYEYESGSPTQHGPNPATLPNPLPLIGAEIRISLNYSESNSITPQTNLSAVEVRVKTDQNGQWAVNLVPNANINPANTTYRVTTPSQRYDILVPSSGPVQSSTIKVNVPATLTPSTSSTGPLTVNGAFTVNTGPVTLPPGSLSVAALSGILPIANGGTGSSTQNFVDLTTNQTAAGNKIWSGTATHNGASTFNATATHNADIVAAARLLLSAAASKIVGGGTSLALRNNADTANNLLMSDAGLATLRNALGIPATPGGSLPPTSYGTTSLKYDEQNPTGISVTVPASGSIPGTFRTIRQRFELRTTSGNPADPLSLRFNGDSGPNYNWQTGQFTGTNTIFSAEQLSGTGIALGNISGGTAFANSFSHGWIECFGYSDTTQRKAITAMFFTATNAGVSIFFAGGEWDSGGNAVTSVELHLNADTFASGSRVVTKLEP